MVMHFSARSISDSKVTTRSPSQKIPVKTLRCCSGFAATCAQKDRSHAKNRAEEL